LRRFPGKKVARAPDLIRRPDEGARASNELLRSVVVSAVRRIDWSPEKNRELKSDATRRICFEDIVAALESGGLLEHPNREKYPDQRMLVVQVDAYAYAVPYLETPEGIFLKTAFPSRRLTAHYLRNEKS
jgi:hypothetical protein